MFVKRNFVPIKAYRLVYDLIRFPLWNVGTLRYEANTPLRCNYTAHRVNGALLHSEQNVQVCDATMKNSSNVARLQKKSLNTNWLYRIRSSRNARRPISLILHWPQQK